MQLPRLTLDQALVYILFIVRSWVMSGREKGYWLLEGWVECRTVSACEQWNA